MRQIFQEHRIAIGTENAQRQTEDRVQQAEPEVSLRICFRIVGIRRLLTTEEPGRLGPRIELGGAAKGIFFPEFVEICRIKGAGETVDVLAIFEIAEGVFACFELANPELYKPSAIVFKHRT